MTKRSPLYVFTFPDTSRYIYIRDKTNLFTLWYVRAPYARSYTSSFLPHKLPDVSGTCGEDARSFFPLSIIILIDDNPPVFPHVARGGGRQGRLSSSARRGRDNNTRRFAYLVTESSEFIPGLTIHPPMLFTALYLVQ